MSTIFDTDCTPVHGVASKKGLIAAGTVVIPANAVVTRVYARNNTANAVTGGIKVGTSAGATDVVAALPVLANQVGSGAAAGGSFNQGATRTLYIDAVTAWNSAVIDVAVAYTILV